MNNDKNYDLYRVPETTTKTWENLLQSISELFDVRFSFIMRNRNNKFEIILQNNNFMINKFEDTRKLIDLCNSFEYTNKIIYKDDLSKNNINFGYKEKIENVLSIPIHWPCGEIFGSICLLDTKKIKRLPKDIKSLKNYVEMIEEQLRLALLLNQFEYINTVEFPKTLVENEEKVNKLENELNLYKYMAKTDFVTNTYNRGYLDEILNNLIYEKKEKNFSLLLIDIKNFKNINSRYGYLVGDKILVYLSTIIKNKLTTDEKIFRYSSDIYAVLLNTNDRFLINTFIREIQDNVSKYTSEEGVTFSISVGVKQYEGESKFSLLEKLRNNLNNERKKNAKIFMYIKNQMNSLFRSNNGMIRA